MKYLKALALSVCVTVILSPLLWAWAASPHRDRWTPKLRGRVVRVIDGDTVVLSINVRLAEIDAPEAGQEHGPQSKHTLQELLPERAWVKCELLDVDRYGRPVMRLFDKDGRDVSLSVVAQGAAWRYDEYSDRADLDEAETAAREKRWGLWAGEPVPPWEWREGGTGR